MLTLQKAVNKGEQLVLRHPMKASSLYTIKNQLLAGYMLLAFFVILLSGSSFWHLSEAGKVRSTQETVSALHVHILHLIQLDGKYLHEEVENLSYHRTGESSILDKRLETKEIVLNILDSMLFMPNLDAYGLEEPLSNTERSWEAYENTFQEVKQLMLTRGFEDFGLEGKMRDYAHTLEENNSSINMVDLLMLRRHEKDYFMRDETKYVGRFNERSKAVAAELSKRVNTKNDLVALQQYTELFNKVVELEEKIGNDRSGMRSKLNMQLEALEQELDQMQLLNSALSEEIINRIKVNYTFSVVVCLLLSLILSYAIASLIARPVKKLARNMHAAIKDDFEGDNEPISIYSATELRYLQESFLFMLEQIRSQLDELQIKKEILSTQNEELSQINEKLAESESSLQTSNSIKDKFFSIIAHDLKGPIGTLSVFLSTLIKYSDSFSKEETKSFASKMLVSVDSLSGLLENLLAWSRSEMNKIPFDPQELEIAPMVSRNLELLEPRAKKKKTQLNSALGRTDKVYADENMVDFLLRNLLANGVKFSNPGGTVSIFSKKVGDHLNISIQDEGIGIAKEHLPCLFDPQVHFTTQGTEKEKGTGLGLILCKEFVQKNGGDIWVESEEKVGSTFTFSLPIHSNNPEKKPNKENLQLAGKQL